MTKRAPGFARAFAGRWRITEMDEWDEIDLLGSAHITFSGKDGGELVFIAIEADLDVCYGARRCRLRRVLVAGLRRRQPRQRARLGRLGYRRPPHRPHLHR
jgi:hypothetical protein